MTDETPAPARAAADAQGGAAGGPAADDRPARAEHAAETPAAQEPAAAPEPTAAPAAQDAQYAPVTPAAQDTPAGDDRRAGEDGRATEPGDAEGTGAGRPEGPGAPAAVPVSPAVHKRLTTGLGGFAMAMGACLLLVLAIYLITPRETKEVLPTVDYGSQLWALRTGAPFTVYAPEGLPPRWRPTSSRVHGLDEGGKKPVAWHLGFVTPADEYAALEQSNEKASEYVPRMTNNRKTLGTQQVAGETWTKYYRKDKKANSLARTLPDGVSLVVTGTASYDELAVLAASLRPQPRQGARLAPAASPTPGS